MGLDRPTLSTLPASMTSCQPPDARITCDIRVFVLVLGLSGRTSGICFDADVHALNQRPA
ncbi:hypothetical protein CPB86DRAFT_399406 [Serendipita vermifera]|nr:hypothetical protein CPB86DRAFT_399406 [Serendipita vermifera]